jgi:hypothetical protein
MRFRVGRNSCAAATVSGISAVDMAFVRVAAQGQRRDERRLTLKRLSCGL